MLQRGTLLLRDQSQRQRQQPLRRRREGIRAFIRRGFGAMMAKVISSLIENDDDDVDDGDTNKTEF